MNFLSIILFFCTTNAFAQVEKFDLTGNGIFDRFEYKENGKITRIDEDRNQDSKIDFRRSYFPKEKVYEIHQQDTDFDGNFDRETSFSNFDDKNYLVTTKIDKNNDGKFEIIYSNIISKTQNKDVTANLIECAKDLAHATDVLHFIEDNLKIISISEDGFLPIGGGFRVEMSCIEKWGEDFPQLVQKSFKNGLQCLQKLYTKPTVKFNNAMSIARDLINSAKTEETSVVCSHTEYKRWDTSAAFASTSEDDQLESPNVSHPYIVLNPYYPSSNPIIDMLTFFLPSEKSELIDTLFHERIHNAGLKHGSGIEAPYACEKCCELENGDVEKIDLNSYACKICSGDYSSSTSIEYINDLIEFSKDHFLSNYALETPAKNYLKENPQNIDGFVNFVKVQNRIFPENASALARLVLDKNKSKLNKTQQDILQNNIDYIPQSADEILSSIAEAQYQLYFNHKTPDILKPIWENREKIKKDIEELKNSFWPNKMEIGINTEKLLGTFLMDMWAPTGSFTSVDNDTSTMAWELKKFFFDEKK